MKASLLSILLLVLALRLHAKDVRFERRYSWGSLQLSASTSETVQLGGISLLVFHTDVLADFRFPQGQRFLIATGRLEVDPATGDFTATDWPFLRGTQANNGLRFSANNEIDSVQFRSGRVKLIGAPKTIIPEPHVIQLRRGQLAKLAERL